MDDDVHNIKLFYALASVVPPAVVCWWNQTRVPMDFWITVSLLSLVTVAGCVAGGATDLGYVSPPNSASSDSGSTPTAWELNTNDFAQPWIRLSVPTGPLESVIAVTHAAQSYMALVRYDNSSGKMVGTVTHRVASSIDGLNWSSENFEPNQDASQGNKYFQAIAFGGERYVVVGYAGINSLLSVSSDGVGWTPLSVGGSGLSFAAFAGERWFTGGILGYVATSLDGLAWSIQKLQDGSINGLAFGNGVYVAAGNLAFWVSSEGQTWEQVNIMCDSAATCPGVTPPGSTFPQPGIVAIDHIFFAQQKFFAGSSSSGYHFASTDGRQWQVVPLGQLSPDLYVGGQFLAVTTDGAVQGSADGTNWTLSTTLTDNNPDGRSCASDRCFVWEQNVILIPSG